MITSENTRKIYQNENKNANFAKIPKSPNFQKNTGFFVQLIRKGAIFILRIFPRPEKEKKMSESLWKKAKFTQCAVMAIHTPSDAPDQLRIHVRAPGSHVGYRLVLGSVPGFWSDWHAEDEKENNGVREHFLTLAEAESLANELLRQVRSARADQGGGK